MESPGLQSVDLIGSAAGGIQWEGTVAFIMPWLGVVSQEHLNHYLKEVAELRWILGPGSPGVLSSHDD